MKYHDQVIDLLRTVSEGVILPMYKNLLPSQIETKTSPTDLVTIADKTAEVALRDGLVKIIPGSFVLGEEMVSDNPEYIREINHYDDVWVVDPIDGTANYAAGRREFACMVSLYHGGILTDTWVHDPLTGRTLFAEFCMGAYVQNAKGSLVAMKIQPQRMAVMCMNPEPSKFRSTIHLGAASHEVWAAVENKITVLHYKHLTPWDHSPVKLIFTEAGGHCALQHGIDYHPLDGLYIENGVMKCSSKNLILSPSAEVNALISNFYLD